VRAAFLRLNHAGRARWAELRTFFARPAIVLLDRRYQKNKHLVY
jgi:hypothetical protein